jgi:hypothetical protein
MFMFPFVFQTLDPIPTNIPTSWTSYSRYKYKKGTGGAVLLIEAKQSQGSEEFYKVPAPELTPFCSTGMMIRPFL